MKVIIASSNRHKVQEFSGIFLEYGIRALGLDLKGIKPPEENGGSFRANADIKALYYSSFTDEPVIADDSGLCVDVLDGAPGIYSSRFAGENADGAANIRKLLDLLKEYTAPSLRKACFKCVLSLAKNGRVIRRTEGIVRGYILFEPSGGKGFGYDPVFYYRPFRKSFAGLDEDEKNRISHRFRACRKLAEYVRSNFIPPLA